MRCPDPAGSFELIPALDSRRRIFKPNQKMVSLFAGLFRVIGWKAQKHERRQQEADARKGEKAMKVKTNLKAGGRNWNHNETLVRDAAKAKGMKVKTNLKAGVRYPNHNETLVRDAAKAKGMKVRTRIKAGGKNINHNETLVRDAFQAR